MSGGYFVPTNKGRHIHFLEETNGHMYNPDFWEVQLDPSDLEMMPAEVGLWYESPDDQILRYNWEDRVGRLIPQIDTLIDRSLTQKQFEATVLYFKHGKPSKKSPKSWASLAGS